MPAGARSALTGVVGTGRSRPSRTSVRLDSRHVGVNCADSAPPVAGALRKDCTKRSRLEDGPNPSARFAQQSA